MLTIEIKSMPSHLSFLGNISDVQRLISEGVDVNVETIEKETPLHFAVHFGKSLLTDFRFSLEYTLI